ncbi:MAG: FG-GAP-like repeat-containing protein [Gemmatimonadota bacterium]
MPARPQRRRPVRAAAAIASLAATACASGQVQPRAAPPSADAAPFRARIDPFPVLDADGAAYAFPFLGGFNVPRPQLVDLDGDSDMDLVVQERTDRLLYFERVDGGYRWAPGLMPPLRVGEWYRFVDVDGDGDPDLLSEEPFSYVRLYRNDGAGGFPLVADTIRDARGGAIFSDRQNIPNAADIDCDGRLDLLIGRMTGTITRYEATGAIGQTVAPFRHVEDRFQGIEIVAEFGNPLYTPPADTAPVTGPSMHGANTMALADADGDGDVDLFWGDFFEPGLLLIENTGSCERPDMTGEPVAFPAGDPVLTSGYNAPTFGDADGDGDLDLVMGVLGGAYDANRTGADNLYFFEQVDGDFALRSTRYISQVDIGTESLPRVVDWDGDGDLDLLLANKIDPTDLHTSRVYLYENVGTPLAPAFRLRGPVGVDGAFHNAPALGDLDADGDLDAVLGTWRPDVELLMNGGTRAEPRYDMSDAPLLTLTRGANGVPALGDLDADGDLDLIIGEASGTLNYYRNDGDPAGARFALVSDEYLGVDVGRRAAPALVDVDGDGDLDLVVGTESDGLVLFLNEGTREVPDFRETASSLPTDLAPYAAPAFGDVDGDGDLDLFVGGVGGGVVFFENVGADVAAP